MTARSMPPHKILLVGPYPPPYGGLSVQLQQWQQYLQKTHGSSCEVLNISEKRKEPVPGAWPVHGYLDFWRKLTKYARNGYLIHLFTNGHNFKSWLSALACALAGCFNHRRTVLVFGSGNLPVFIQKSGPLALIVAGAALRLSGEIVCRNDEMRDAIVKFGGNRSKVSIISGYYGTFDHSAEVPRTIENFLRKHHPIIGVTATTLGPEYGVRLLLDAAQQLLHQYPNLGIVVLGIGDNHRPQLRIHEQTSVCLAGALTNPIALAVMSRLTIFVRPTLFDGDSRSVREALSLGIPVVASDTGYRPPGVKLFKSGSVADMTTAIRGVIDGSERVPTLRQTSTGLESIKEMLLIYSKLV